MKLLIWGICLVVFCLPLYSLRLTVFNVPATVLELMIHLLFIGWLINELRIRNQESWVRRLRNFIIHNSSFIIPISLILIGVTLATIFSSDLRTSAGIWKGWFVAPLLFFLVLVATIKTFSQIKKILLSLFLSGTVVAIISLIYLIQGKLDPFGRLQAFYNSPNYLAMYLAPILIVGVGYYLFTFLASPSEARSGTPPSLPPRSCGANRARSGCITRKKIIPSTSILLLVACLLLSVILFFTESFGAWLGIAAAIFFVSLWLTSLPCGKAGRRLGLLILVLTLIAVLFLGYSALIHRESSFDARLIIWQKTLEIFKTNPILGIGPGTLGDYFSPYPKWGVPQPHNIFLAFLLQTGIIGFIGFIWLLIWFFRVGIKLLNVNCYVLIVMCIMVYILVHGLVDTTYWKNDLSVIFWTVIALMVVFRHSKIRNFIR